ncbi:MAG: BatD family protein [Weeksellaceae bacterium]
MTRNLFFVLLILGTASLLRSQEISFKSVADKTEVSVNERFSVQFVLTYGQENVSVDHPIRLPDFGGLQQLGESTINRFQFSNGVAINQVGIEAILVADHEGTYNIGSALISLGGKKYKTDPIKITVKKGLKPKEPAGQRMNEAFISAELSDENPFINQAVILVIKMYSREYGLFQRLRNYKEPDFNDVIAKFVSERSDDSEKQVLVNGRTFISKELARYVLFPQKAGDIEIDPFSVNVFISSFYGAENIPLSTEPIMMHVKNLPTTGRPAKFSGAVGEFTLNTNISKTEAKSNETINLEVEIIGSGNLNTLKAPDVSVPENIETYPPKKRDAYDLRPNGLKGKIVETHLLVPQYGGNYTVGPIAFNYFDPGQKKYITLNSKAYQLNISGPQPPKDSGKTAKNDLVPNESQSEPAPNSFMSDLPQSLTEVKNRVTKTVEKDNNWIWIIGGLISAFTVFYVFRKRKSAEKDHKSEKQLLSEFKSEISKQLSELNTLANNQNKDEFLNLQEKILTEIGIQYSGISLSEFTENDAAQKLKEKFGDTADRWKMLLLDCKSSKYGLGAPNIDLNSRYAETENLWKSFQK